MRTIVKEMLEAPFTDAKNHMVGQNGGLGELFHFTYTIWSIVANRSPRFLCLRFVGRARAGGGHQEDGGRRNGRRV